MGNLIEKFTLEAFPRAHRARLYRWILNVWPCIRGTGVRVEEISPDFTYVRGRLPLNWRTRNRVGTIFGGSLYGACDPFLMLQLMEILGRDFVVWDKAASIRFRRPGTETLWVEFRVTPEEIARVRDEVAARGEGTFDWKLELKSAGGAVHAEVTKSIFVASRSAFEAKRAAAKADRHDRAAP